MTARSHAAAGPALVVEVLGPLRLTVDGTPVDVPGPRRRALLALLALARGRSVTVDELLGAIWPSEMPDSGRRALHSHVSRLRSHLGPAASRLARDGDGYRLDLAADELDVAVVEQLAARSRDAAPAEAVAQLRSAAGRWRGTALDEFADVAGLAAEAAALAELRKDLGDQLLEARLALGADPDLTADAARAAASDPLRERTHVVLARALATAGRTAEALRVLHDLRERLVEATGLDPSPGVVALEGEIAAGVLAPAAAAGPRRIPSRPAAPLVGREQQLEQARDLVSRERLVTVVGPGGVGKTRLVMELAAGLTEAGVTEAGLTETALTEAALTGVGLAEAGSTASVPGGGARAVEVAVAELAAVDGETDDMAGVARSVATALGLRSPGGEGLVEAVIDRLAAGRAVLVLDNCEHVLDACRDLAARLIAACPDLTVIATSREALGLPAEHVLRLGPLAVPPPGASPTEMAAAPAVLAFRLHAERRAGRVELDDHDLRMVAEIARRLDGLPLALELAAGRTTSLSVTDLRDRLGRALDLLESGRTTADQRHRTLRSTIEWSYRLLREDEQCLLRSLAPLPGDFALDAAEHLASAAGVGGDPAAHLARLVDASVVAREAPSVGGRYRLLETVRAFALEQLVDTGQAAAAEVALANYGAALAQRIGSSLNGPDEPRANERLRRELVNLRSARQAALAHGLVPVAVDISVELGEAALWRDLPELNAWAIELASRADVAGLPRAPDLLGTAARACWLSGELDGTIAFAEAGLALATTSEEATCNLDALATAALFRGEFPRARRLYNEAEAGRPLHPTLPASAALAAVYEGDLDGARAELARARQLAERVGAPTFEAYNLYVTGELEAATDPAAAVEAYSSSIELARRSGAGFVEGVASVGLVGVWTATRQLDRALQGFAWLVEHWRRTGSWTQQWTTLRNLAYLLVELGDHSTAALLLSAADHAVEAAALEGDAVASRAWTAIEAALDDAELERVRRRAAIAPRVEVVSEALTVIAERLAS